MKFKTLWLSGEVFEFLTYLPSSSGYKSNPSNVLKNFWNYNHLIKSTYLLHFWKKVDFKQTSCLEVLSIASLQICRNNQNSNFIMQPKVRSRDNQNFTKIGCNQVPTDRSRNIFLGNFLYESTHKTCLIRACKKGFLIHNYKVYSLGAMNCQLWAKFQIFVDSEILSHMWPNFQFWAQHFLQPRFFFHDHI